MKPRRPEQNAQPQAVAVIGMSCKMPGADGVEEFWRLLLEGGDAVTDVPADRFPIEQFHSPVPGTSGRTVSRHGGFLADAFGFDTAFFGIAPSYAEAVDPQQRLLLHLAWEALEAAGLRPADLRGSSTGVFVGQATADFADTSRPRDADSVRHATGSRIRAMSAGRISHALDLRGPSLVMDTACSSSLAAVHAARCSLLLRESDLALACGVNLILSPEDAIAYSQANMLSPGGRCRFGDASADGFVRSEGAGVVVLKRLADAERDGDRVLAVLAGSAVANDGASSGLQLHPSTAGQLRTLHEAWRSAGITADQLDCLEAHGTGTPVGDDVELSALTEALRGRPAVAPLPIGSVKSNIGHAEAAAGIAGLIKAVLMVRHRTVPASLHLDTPHALLAGDGPLRLVTANEPLGEGGRVPTVGVSSFGLSGTNVHVVVRGPGPAAAPGPVDHQPAPGTGGLALLLLSARTPAALRQLARAHHERLMPDGADSKVPLRLLCASAARRQQHQYRLWAVADSHQALARVLSRLLDGEATGDGGFGDAGATGVRRVVFVFPGQGAQWPGMARELLADSPAFKDAVEQCAAAVQEEAGWELSGALGDTFPTDVARVQPALWAFQTALAAHLGSLGVRPDTCLGHSMGEVAAAQVAGMLGVRDAARVIGRRSALMGSTAGSGAMMLTGLSAPQARASIARYGSQVCVAAENAPSSTVLSGDRAALEELARDLDRTGVLCRPVRVDAASHSPHMEPLREPLLSALAGVRPVDSPVTLLSTVRGRPVRGRELDAGYWWDGLRQPVLFSAAAARAATDHESVFVEISPHPLLAGAIDEIIETAHAAGAVVPVLRRDHAGAADVVRAVGRVAAAGGAVDWEALLGPADRRVALPPYPWQNALLKPASPGSGEVFRDIPLTALGSERWGDGIEVRGSRPLPPVTHVAALLLAAEDLVGGDAWDVADVALSPETLFLDQAAAALLRVALSPPRADGSRLAAVTARPSPDAVPLAPTTARLVPRECAPPGQASADLEVSIDLDRTLDRCPDHVGERGVGRLAAELGVVLGDAFAGVEHLWRGPDRAVARVRLPEAGAPAAWETALFPLLFALPSPGSGTAPGDRGHLPLRFGHVRLLRPLPERFWSVCTVTALRPGGGAWADVTVLDDDRRLVARWTGIETRPAGAAGQEPPRRPATVLDMLHTARTTISAHAHAAQHLASPVTAAARSLLGAALSGLTARPATAAGQAPVAADTPAGAPPRVPPAPAGRAPAPQPHGTGLLPHAAAVLGVTAQELDQRRSLRDHGLDSLLAAQLSRRLLAHAGIDFGAGRLLGDQSIAALLADLDAPHT